MKTKLTFEEQLKEAEKLLGIEVDGPYTSRQVFNKIEVIIKGQKSSELAENDSEQHGYSICLSSGDVIVPYKLLRPSKQTTLEKLYPDGKRFTVGEMLDFAGLVCANCGQFSISETEVIEILEKL